jgi:hypothetical protein
MSDHSSSGLRRIDMTIYESAKDTAANRAGLRGRWLFVLAPPLFVIVENLFKLLPIESGQPVDL